MFRDHFWGQGGFEELRRYIKSGNDFTKEVASIMQERSDAENIYSKSLTRLATKLSKYSSVCVGTLASAWSLAATEMETEGELHKQLAQALHEDLYKPLKSLSETQSKTRKPIESLVEKAVKAFMDKRGDEIKSKQKAFACAKEREKLSTQMGNSKIGKGKVLSDKDFSKLEKRIRVFEDSLRKADKEYHEMCQKTEATRQEWEAAVYKGSSSLQTLEEERINQSQDFLNKYNSHLSVIGPKLVRSCEKLGEAVLSVDTNSDIRKAVEQRGTGPNQPEQSLPDFYAEDGANTMDKERRRQCLQNYLIYIQQDIDREVKGKEGVEKLVEVYRNRPNFADAEAQEDARNRLMSVSAMLNYLEATRYKLSCALAELEGQVKPTSKYSQHIERTKDKQGLATSVLRLPASMIHEGMPTAEVYNPASRPPGDGDYGDQQYYPPIPDHMSHPHHDAGDTNIRKVEGSYGNASTVVHRVSLPKRRTSQLPSVQSHASMSSFTDDDEFDDLPAAALGQCRAIYDYAAQQFDELSIRQGDVVTIYQKQEDGWWQGELNGKSGIFPATYVEEFVGGSESHL